MLFYSYRIIIWEQHDWKNPPLVTRAHQALDEVRHFWLDHRLTFRSDSQSYRSGCRKRILRQQLIVLKRQVKRPQLSNLDRFRLVFLSHFTAFWRQALHIVQPDTLLRWHRELFQFFYWVRKLQSKPKIPPETIALIEKMAKENGLWGAERIRGELLKLGIEVIK